MQTVVFAGLLGRLGASFRHAFSTQEPELTAEEKAILDRAAEIVARKGLAGPATLFLESSRPLNFLASQMIAFLEPYLAAPLGVAGFRRLSSALEKRASIEYLIQAVDRQESTQG